jgi:hypothetical protein
MSIFEGSLLPQNLNLEIKICWKLLTYSSQKLEKDQKDGTKTKGKNLTN